MDALQYVLDLGGVVFPLREVAGREAISTPFRIEARFFLERGLSFDPDALVKTPAVIAIDRGGRLERRIDGVVTQIALEATTRGASEVTVVLEPRLALLRHRIDIRHFRDKTAPEIVTEVIRGLGLPVELRLSGSYARRPYCVQLRESDLDFVQRLLEDEGIFYFFVEGDVVVLGDDPAAYPEIAPAFGAAAEREPPIVPFRGMTALDKHEEGVSAIGRRAALAPTKVTLRDFNPERPSLDMEVHALVHPPGSVGKPGRELGVEYYEYPGEYELPVEGARKARLFAQTLSCHSAAFEGKSFCPRLVPGSTFTLSGSPAGVGEGRLVVTALTHAWSRERGGYENAFDALGASVAYRPARVTPAPRLTNPITGFVTGPPGEDIHTDALGRVKVHFQWDRRYPLDDTCSHWVPVLQDNTGHSSAIPRIGWEVLVHFLEGDPDRPVVLGRVYNGADPFPEPLPEGKTRSALKSLSSPGRGGHNMMRFDDAGGAEEVHVHAEKDQNVVVANDKNQDVLSEETTNVQRDETISVGSNHTSAVGANMKIVVGNDQTLSVGAKRSRKVGGSSESTTEKDHTLTIGAMHSRRIGADDKVSAKDLKEQVGGVILEASVKPNATSAGKAMALTVGGVVVEACLKSKSESSGKARIETIGGIVFSKSAKATTMTTKTTRVTSVGGALTVTSAKAISLKGTLKVSLQAMLAKLTADSSLTLKVGGSSVVLKDGVIQVTAAGKIAITVGGPNAQAAGLSAQN